MGGFITSVQSLVRHGAYAVERTPPAVVQVLGSGVACMVAQLPWGRDTEVVTPAGIKERTNEFAPPGMDRTGSGYLSMIRKSFPTLLIVRAVGTSPVKAVATLTSVGPVSLLTLTLKYYGVAGNSVIATVKNASDGDVNHFDMDVVVSGASGSTKDIFQNLNYSGTGTDSAPDFTNALLLGAITKIAAGRPTNGDYTFSTGTVGTINSASYVGTAGTGDKGLAKAEGDLTIRHVFTDDAGNTLRAAVNAGLQAHGTLMGDRVAYINGDNSLSLAATQTDASNYRSTRVVYMDPWPYILDDVDGTKRAVPPSAFGASVGSQVTPSTSIAWKDPEVGAMLEGINSLVADRGNGAGSNTLAGIVTIIKEENGGYRFEADPTTNAPVDPAKKSLRRTRVGDAIAVSWTRSIRSLVDAPNVEPTQNACIMSLDTLLSGLKRAQFRDPAHNLFVKDYQVPALGSTDDEIQAGFLEVDTAVKVGSAAEKIILGIQFGETVRITAS